MTLIEIKHRGRYKYYYRGYVLNDEGQLVLDDRVIAYDDVRGVVEKRIAERPCKHGENEEEFQLVRRRLREGVATGYYGEDFEEIWDIYRLLKTPNGNYIFEPEDDGNASIEDVRWAYKNAVVQPVNDE